MNLHPPTWWQNNTHHILPKYLSPLGFIYGKIVEARFRLTKPYHPKVPVICIGNFTLGGTGKTPIAIKIAALLRDLGHSPTILSRGYKGKYAGPLLVNKEEHDASDVGDEPLLLSNHAPTVIAKNRVEGAWLIEQRNSDFIIMDDGFQNPHLFKNLSLIAIDADFRTGNGHIFPAGPLRASMAFQVPKADIIIITGGAKKQANGKLSIEQNLRENFGYDGPILHGTLTPNEDTDWLKEKPIFAFAGIGRPEKFFNSLVNAGGQVIRRMPFPDHHTYSQADAQSLVELALRDDLQLVTTTKDLVRMSEDEGRHIRALKRMSRALKVKFTFNGEDEQKLIEHIKTNFPVRPMAD